jgi:hypothetical protein
MSVVGLRGAVKDLAPSVRELVRLPRVSELSVEEPAVMAREHRCLLPEQLGRTR